MTIKATWTIAALLGLAASISAQVIDTSETRVQTTLDPGLKRIGTLKPRAVGEIAGQNWAIGCETLDRAFASYDSYKDYLVPLGIKKIRLQGGWANTEREKGKYDWRWLDRVIDDARSRGLEIFLETNYGNPIYPGGGGRGLAGGFPTSDEAWAAWDKWVEAMATRYQGKVRDWEMWNEPDGNKAHTPAMTADMDIRTAEIIKRVIPEARIAGGVLCSPNPVYAEGWLKRVTELKKESLFTWFIYHGYTRNPDQGHYENVEKLKVLFENKRSGQTLLVFWDKSNVPSNTNSTVAATFTIAKDAFTEPVWVDLITGGIHAIPSEKFVAEGGKVTFKDIPVYDAPALITEKSLVLAPTKTKGL